MTPLAHKLLEGIPANNLQEYASLAEPPSQTTAGPRQTVFSRGQTPLQHRGGGPPSPPRVPEDGGDGGNSGKIVFAVAFASKEIIWEAPAQSVRKLLLGLLDGQDWSIYHDLIGDSVAATNAVEEEALSLAQELLDNADIWIEFGNPSTYQAALSALDNAG